MRPNVRFCGTFCLQLWRAGSLRLLSAFSNKFQYVVGFQRQARDFDAERIRNGIRQGGARCGDAAFTGSFDTERIVRARKVFRRYELRVRDFHCRWEQVIHEARREGLSVAVVNKFFQKRAAYSLGESAGHLALDDHRVDLTSDILGDEVIEDFDGPGLAVHLDGSHVYAVWKRALIGREEILFRNSGSHSTL